ncbi:hypothetical protein BU25DRAFT_426762 [Macroventuria anomochaeta]|uniref:Uncharacterized protein n=1 Tax=Macroventuria anomochaeta TaxID=301207 RepID=A0ACB6RI83_9PLEO|nr:uncharacterized protein BU25DRAFT_426762 [Macroventuria anomochaeta]KAF2621072.1 hypothetical protein BU25DRAFT_426762 [Macroventuria anomochaeta]
MPLKWSHRQKINEPAPKLTQDAPATPAYSKHQRTSTSQFEVGVNPFTPPSTVRRPSLRPPASQATEAGEESLFVRGEDSDDAEADADGDPNPEEVVDDAEALSEVNVDAGEDSAAEFPEPEHGVVATLRYRAAFGNIEKNPIHSAADSMTNYKVDRLTMTGLWMWVDEVIDSQVNRRSNVKVVSLVAELWFGRCTNKRNRPQKRLWRGNVQDVHDLRELAKSLDLDTSEKLTIDFNLYLTGDPIPVSQLTAPPPLRSFQTHTRTATVIQEEALDGVVAANLMGH